MGETTTGILRTRKNEFVRKKSRFLPSRLLFATAALLSTLAGDATVAASSYDVAHHTVKAPNATKLACPKSICGHKNPRYSILHVDAESETLIVGLTNYILQAPLRNISKGVRSARLEIDPMRLSSCRNTTFQCENHPKYLLWHPEENRFVLCATHAREPRRYAYNVSSNVVTPLERYSGYRYCAPIPEFNSTAAMTSAAGNPLGAAAVVSATFKDARGIQPVIFRPRIHEGSAPTMQSIESASWLDNPQFVGSFEHEEHVYFFFREVSQRGRSIQSRVARVCKSDVGNYPILTDAWTTFVKARLNCSLPGEYPYYFDEIQSVYSFRGPGGGERFVAAVFKTNENAVLASALCVFRMDDVEEVFRGDFAEEMEFGFLKPVAADAVPTDPRPGTCVEKSSDLGPAHARFIKAHPMMLGAVDAAFKKPVFHRVGIDLQSVTTDSVQTRGGRRLYVHFLGSADGRLFRVVQDGGGHFRSRGALDGGDVEFDFHSIDGVGDAGRLVSVYEAFESEVVNKVAIWRNGGENGRLYVASSSSVIQVGVHNCDSYADCSLCVRDPYCAWTDGGTCVKAGHGNSSGVQMVHSSTKEINDVCRPAERFALSCIIKGGTKLLKCKDRFRSFTSRNTYWTDGDEEISVGGSDDKKVLTADGNLFLNEVDEGEAGTYRCRLRSTGDAIVTFFVKVVPLP